MPTHLHAADTNPKMGQTLAKCFGPAPAAASTGVTYEHWAAFEAKMKKEGLNDAAIGAFKYNYEKLASGADLMLPESSISPVSTLPSYEALTAEDPTLLKSTVVLKLNGGLGTGMGLEKAKSLLPLKGKDTFLDFIAKQVLHMREAFGVDLAFMLMNSFSTSADTKKALKKYKGLASADLGLEFVQNKAPKVAADDLAPSSWPKSPAHEWCPPGHGDLYAALEGSGKLDALLAAGVKYMFVSNSDNLGATLDLKLLTWFARSAAPFAIEVCERTEADKKGGHLAKSVATGELLLRESAQCAAEDEAAFQDVTQHKFFNTNNLCAKSCLPRSHPRILRPALSGAPRGFAQVGRPRRSARGSAAARRGRPASARHEEWQDRRPARQGEPEGASARDRDGRCDPMLPGRAGARRQASGDARRTTPAWSSTPSHPSPAGDLRPSLALRAGEDDG